jgi:membrane protein DedA with SNARE-associated domain/membrane-associated phospholipid phosphatase
MIIGNIKPLLDWIHLHPHWAGIATYFIALFECLAFVGLVLPGVVMMVAIGTLIGTGVLPFTSIILWAIAGAISGDVLSFWLGYRYQIDVRHSWLFRTHPGLFQKGEAFFLRHGGKGLFVGRMIGPLRPILPLIAGMMSMSPVRFLLVDVISGIVWAFVYLLPGIIIGAASQELAPKMATQLILVIVVVLLALWCISWLIKRIYTGVFSIFSYLLARLWSFIKNRSTFKFIEWLLIDPMRPESHSQLTLVILLVISLVIFFNLVGSVLNHGLFTVWNEPVYYFMRTLRTTVFDPVMVAITTVNPLVLAIMWVAVLGWLLLRRYHWAAAHWLILGLLTFVCRLAIKHLMQLPRPPGLLQIPAGWSFPSGHGLLSVAFLGFLAVLLARNWQREQRWLTYLVAGLLAICIMFSRLYLGAHWLTDEVGSALLGFAIAALVTLSYRRRVTPSVEPVGILLIALLALLISWSGYLIYHFKKDLRDYTPTWVTQTLDKKKWWAHKTAIEPLYRTSRFGKPVEMLNIQWAGSLPRIAQTLNQQDWNLLPKSSLVLMLNSMTSKDKNQSLPILNQLFEDHKPVLVMFKMIEQPQPAVLVLRLWDAHLKLNDDTPVWLGTVTYHKPWRTHLFRRLKQTDLVTPPLPIATDVLLQNLPGWRSKKIADKDTGESVVLIK